jgi:hypothetical protein
MAGKAEKGLVKQNLDCARIFIAMVAMPRRNRPQLYTNRTRGTRRAEHAGAVTPGAFFGWHKCSAGYHEFLLCNSIDQIYSCVQERVMILPFYRRVLLSTNIYHKALIRVSPASFSPSIERGGPIPYKYRIAFSRGTTHSRNNNNGAPKKVVVYTYRLVTKDPPKRYCRIPVWNYDTE